MIQPIDFLISGARDTDGSVLASGTVKSYLAGTTTLQTLYQDKDLSTPHSNPLTLDAAGRVVAYTDQRVKLVVQDSDGSVVNTYDHVGVSDTDVNVSGLSALAGDGITVASDGKISVNTDGTTTSVNSSGQIIVQSKGIGESQLADSTITPAKFSSENIALSSAITYSGTPGLTETEVTNATVSLTVEGLGVEVGLTSDGSANASYVKATGTVSNAAAGGRVYFFRDGVKIANYQFGVSFSSGNSHEFTMPSCAVFHKDTSVTAGDHTWVIKVTALGGATIDVQNAKMYAKER